MFLLPKPKQISYIFDKGIIHKFAQYIPKFWKPLREALTKHEISILRSYIKAVEASFRLYDRKITKLYQKHARGDAYTEGLTALES
jgi:hypothetical protein